MTEAPWDCVVVGGGAAGLSAALVLGRACRRTLVVDAGNQSNLAAPGIGGLLGNDGRTPAELYASGRRDLAAYPSVVITEGEVVDGARVADLIELRFADGRSVRGRRVLLATGMDYVPPDVKGLAELWGDTVFHCPFCDGWEQRGLPLAVLAWGEDAIHQSLLLRGWTDDIVLLTDGQGGIDDDDRARLTSGGVIIDERPVDELVGTDGRLTAVRFADGDTLPRQGLLVSAGLHQRSDLAERLGAEPGEATPSGEQAVWVDDLYRTTAQGIFAAGDLSAQVPQVVSAISTGSGAAEAIVQCLLADEVGLPVPDWPTRAESES